MIALRTGLFASFWAFGVGLFAQPDSLLLANDEFYIMGDPGEDPSPDLNAYEFFNGPLGGDSIRICGGFPCIGWVEDHYPSGALKHRGYYDAGKLTVYKNYYLDGSIEREFKGIDAVKSIMRIWHTNGQLRSETRYADGTAYQFEDHYMTGQLRYAEERHRSQPCYTRMELYAADGTPISLLRSGKGKLEFEQEEFHPGGALKCKGTSKYNIQRMDSQRTGTWIYFDRSGAKVLEEDYVDGKVHASRAF